MSDGADRSAPPMSPCRRICTLDARGDHCTACQRTLAEIRGWWAMDDAQKRAVLADLPRRASADREPPLSR